ncbi:MAG: RNA polymerase sigma factor [Deltaproteobacteria bacterium]|nr:MAG: RNA polymerase sigma factor [Deltaproteobacteria bacterium]RLF31706.1 MAG: RNA polymerase sigma factor [Thermoplasmata archaeon]
MVVDLHSGRQESEGGAASLQEQSDEQLLERFKGGDRAAFEVIFRRHRQRLFRFILGFLRDRHATEDAVQDLFLKVIRDPSRFQARSRFSTWLHAVARNLCIDLLRKRRYRRAASLDRPRRDRHGGEGGPPAVERVAGREHSPQWHAERSSERLRLLAALSRLPDEQRVVFLLREVAGLQFQEIARIMGAPLNTTKSRMRYALANLRRLLEGLPE